MKSAVQRLFSVLLIAALLAAFSGVAASVVTLMDVKQQADQLSADDQIELYRYIKEKLLEAGVDPAAIDAEPSKKPVQTYVLNKSTRKFHYPSCSSVKQMKDKNKQVFTGTREEVINKGYAPCKNCNP